MPSEDSMTFDLSDDGSTYVEQAPRAGAALPLPDGLLRPEIDAEFAAADSPRHLRDYLRVLDRHRRLVALCFLVTVALTLVITALSPRRYSASTRLQIARQAPIRLRLEQSVRRLDDGDTTEAASFLATQIAALQSRDLAERVLHSRQLGEQEMSQPASANSLQPLAVVGSLPKALRPRGWNKAEEETPQLTDGPAAVDPQLIDRYMRYLSVTEVRGTDLVDVRFTTPSPALSAFLVAAHTQAYMETNEEAQRATDTLAGDFLRRQLRASRKQIKRAATALNRFAVEHPQVAVNQEQKLAANRMAEVSSLLTEAEAARTSLESRYEFLTSPDAGRLAYFLDRPSVEKLRAALADVRTQRAALSGRLGPKHRQMLELKQLEAELDRQVRAEIGQEVAAVRAHYDAARLREGQLRRKLEQQEALDNELRRLGARYDVLKHRLEAAQNLQTSLLKQRTETAVNAALVASNIRVIERPEIPLWPSKPKVPFNLAIGMAAALLLAVGAAFARDYFDTSVRSDGEVAEMLQLPTLGTIPNFGAAHRADRQIPGPLVPVTAANGLRREDGQREELMVLHEPRSIVAEAFRTLRTAMLFPARGMPPTVILVTSARSAEGKTMASVNLATALAETGARALLVDADLRYPRCHALLGVDNDRGLASVLAGQAMLDGMIRSVDGSGFFFLSAGPPPLRPAEMLGSERMRQVLVQLRREFDFVILDSSPVLPATDAVVLARQADGVVLVVKGYGTPREIVRLTRDRLAHVGANLLGFIMNDVDLRWGDPVLYASADYSGRDRGAERGKTS